MTTNIDLIASLRASEPLLKQQKMSIVWAIVNEDGTATASGASFENDLQASKLVKEVLREVATHPSIGEYKHALSFAYQTLDIFKP